MLFNYHSVVAIIDDEFIASGSGKGRLDSKPLLDENQNQGCHNLNPKH